MAKVIRQLLVPYDDVSTTVPDADGQMGDGLRHGALERADVRPYPPEGLTDIA